MLEQQYNECAAYLYRHLPHDVVGREDGLEVEPRRLHLQPVVHDVLEIIKGLLPFHDSIEERSYVPGGLDHVDTR